MKIKQPIRFSLCKGIIIVIMQVLSFLVARRLMKEGLFVSAWYCTYMLGFLIGQYYLYENK